MLNTKEKELKAAYVDEAAAIMAHGLKERFESWQKYFEKDVARVVQLENGDLYAIDKPSIETSFCYGYHGWEDSDGARRMANRTESDGGEIFKAENLARFDANITSLKDDRMLKYIRVKYNGSPENTKIKELAYYYNYERERAELDAKRDGRYELSDADRQTIITAYETERKEFEKRLDAYLKRYGTSKLKTWTYWEDE